MTKIISRQTKKLQLNKSNHTGILDSVFTLSITSEYEEVPVWQSSNEDVAKVDQNGNVTLVGEGSATITVTSGELVGKCSIEVVLSDEQRFIRDLQKGGNVKLTTDITLTAPVTIKNTVILDLNNHDIVMSTEGQDAIWVLTGGNLTINGNGNVIGTYYSLYAGGNAQVVINGGNYVGVGAAIYAQSTAVVEINAGRFEANNEDPNYGPHDYTLNLKDNSSAQILVKGGEFYNFNPADCVSEGPNTNFVVSGYESIETEPGIWEVSKIESKLDTTKIYYGVINNGEGLYTSFDDITEDMIVEGINQGKINNISSGVQELIIPISMADIAVILIPTDKYKAYKDNLGTKSPFNEVNTGLNFHANGKQFGNFFMFGEWFTSVDGANLKVYVE